MDIETQPSRPQWRPLTFALATAFAALTLVACADDASSTATTVAAATLTPVDALVAITAWEITEHEPSVDDAGEPILPVIYFAAEAGDTIDIGVQAAVVERTADLAVVRFSDTGAESIDDAADTAPVRDDGVMFIVDDLPLDGTTFETIVRRYRSIDDNTTFVLRLRATPHGAVVAEATEQVSSAD